MLTEERDHMAADLAARRAETSRLSLASDGSQPPGDARRAVEELAAELRYLESLVDGLGRRLHDRSGSHGTAKTSVSAEESAK